MSIPPSWAGEPSTRAIAWQGTDLYVRDKTITVLAAFTAAENSPEAPARITRTTGSFITDGFKVGDMITTGATGNRGPFAVYEVAAGYMELLQPFGDQSVVDLTPAASTQVHRFIPLGEFKETSGLGDGQAQEIPATFNRSSAVTVKKGVPDFGSITTSGNLIPSDRGQRRCMELWLSPDEEHFVLFYRDSSRREILAYVMNFGESGEVDGLLSFAMTLRVNGRPVYVNATTGQS